MHDIFGSPQRCGANQTAVSPRCRSSLTRFVLQLQSVHVSRTAFRSTTFLLILACIGITGCGVSIPGGTSKTSTAGVLSISSSSLSFGSVTVGNTAAATVTVTNSGTAALQLSQAQVTGQYYSLTGSTSPLSLAAGSSATLTVNFAPKVAGSAVGVLAVTTPDSTTNIPLSGTGTAAQVAGLSLSTASLAFGAVTVNTPVTQSVTLTSSGTAPLTISAATLAGSGFSMSGVGLPLTLSPGQTASVRLTFDPANAGPFSGSLTLATNASTGDATIQMSGTGATLQSVLNNFTCDSDNLAGQGTENCAITLSSPAGTGGLTVGLSSSSSSVIVPSQVTVAEGTSSGSFSLAYFPVATAQTVTLTASTTNSHKQHNLNLGSSSSPGLKLNPTSLSFGSVMLNSTASQSVTVTSSGTTALTISAAAVSGTGFNISGLALPLTLNPGQTANLTVSFDPSAAGSVTGAVTLSTNATTANIALSGTGQAPAALSRLSCASSSMTGSGNDACTVSLTSAAGSNGVTVALGSSSTAVVVPGSVLVPAGATSAGFNAAVSSVTTAQTATLTAQASGATTSYAISLGAMTPGLTLASANLSFGTIALNTPTSQSVLLTSSGTAPVTISAGAVTGSGFSVAGPSFPVSLNPGQSASLTVQFDPTAAGAVTGAVTLTTNTPAGTASIALSGTGQAPASLSGISCANGSMTAAGNDACTVSLSSVAGAGGLSVALSSSSSAVVVPGSVLVPAGASSIGFNAAVSSVTTTQTATLTAQAGGATKTYAISLGPGTPGLTLASTKVSFGNVNLNSPATQTVLLTSSGTSPVTISGASVSGAGFTISGLSLPLTLNPGATAMLNIQFDPTTAGSVTGTVTLSTNASPSTASVVLSGTGLATSYQVDLTWTAPASSSDPVAGYNVYRAVSGSSSYQLLNSGSASTTYADTTVVNGTSYSYYVESVDSSGNQSAPSNIYSVAIP